MVSALEEPPKKWLRWIQGQDSATVLFCWSQSGFVMSHYVSVVAVAIVLTSWIIGWTDLFDFFSIEPQAG